MMSIEIYASMMMKLFAGVFLLSVLAGVTAVVSRIRKRTVKYWWLIPCAMVYSVVAVFNTFIASIAYDDPADPNYSIYKGWELRDFILNDLKVFAIGLFLVALLYLILRRKNKLQEKTGRRAALIVLAVLLAGAVVSVLFSPKEEQKDAVIEVEGFALTFPAEGGKITVEELEAIAPGSSGVEIRDKLGEPDAWIGSGMLRMVYFVEGNRAAVFHFTYPACYEDLKEIVLYGGKE